MNGDTQMATLPNLVDAISTCDGRDRASIAHVARVVREAGYIVNGPRGSGAPDMDMKSAANLLIALNGCDFPKEAPLAIDRFRSLACHPIFVLDNCGSGFEDFGECRTFGDALEHMISSRSLLNALFSVWLAKTRPRDLLSELEEDSEEWHQAFEIHYHDFISLMTSAGRPFLVSVELSRYFAKIEVCQSWDQKTILEARYYQETERLIAGFYGFKSLDRRVTCSFGFDTLVTVWATLMDKTSPQDPDTAANAATQTPQ
jgi:hypothetical protein